MKTSKTIINVLAASVATIAYAGEKAAQQQDNIKNFGVATGINYNSSFVFRGLKLDNNAVFRPYVDTTYKIGSNVFGLDSVYVVASTTQTLNTSQPNATWSRSDTAAGVVVQKDKLTVGTLYQVVNSPNGAFKSAQGINVEVSYDDSDLLGACALQPHASVYFGIDGRLGGGTNAGKYYEVGVSPGTSLGAFKFTTPVVAGFGAGGYYNNNTSSGFVSAGVQAETNISTNVTLQGGINYFNTSSKINDKDNFWQSTLGVGWKF